MHFRSAEALGVGRKETEHGEGRPGSQDLEGGFKKFRFYIKSEEEPLKWEAI